MLSDVNNKVIQEKEVTTLKSLNDAYISALRIHGFSQEYISLWLKTKLENHEIGLQLSFNKCRLAKVGKAILLFTVQL